MGDKNPAKKKYSLEKERKPEKNYCNKINNKKRKKWHFYERRVRKKFGAICIADWRSTTPVLET